ncbi:Endoribonuclease YbeY [Novipirellula aureliae]|uniref:Endoribonuclease YbeY n=1 Tax=Novipirellula aureliae TaxID=2527966 RepID=A0A5C6E396_9BACT|nr:rRNA maturation RNase YbeY [Novipirellula aureliae]TWU41639.1 Endoribonuclease YbeY [Novipirellula aureliae]
MSNILDNNPHRNDRLSIEIIADAPLPELHWYDSIQRAAAAALDYRGFAFGEVGIRITNDNEIRLINRVHLGHDYETDVISFGYFADAPRIEGELAVSLETAQRAAEELAWPAEHELLLYVVHGTLHLTGMDDQAPQGRRSMRAAEIGVMRKLGIEMTDAVGPDAVDAHAGESNSHEPDSGQATTDRSEVKK